MPPGYTMAGASAGPDLSLIQLAVYGVVLLVGLIFVLTILAMLTLPIFFAALGVIEVSLKFVQNLPDPIGKFSKIAGLVFRSLRRNLLRTSLTYAALFILTGMLTFIYSIVSFLGAITQEKEDNLQVIMTERFSIPSQMPPGYANALRNIIETKLAPENRPRVIEENFMTWSFVGGSLDPDKFTMENGLFMFCLEPDALLYMMNDQGLKKDDIGEEGVEEMREAVRLMKQDKRNVIIGEERLKKIGKQVGDEFTMYSMNYKNLKFNFKVVATFPKASRYGQSAAMRADYLEAKLADYQQAFKQPHPQADRSVNLIWVRLPTKAAYEQLAAIVNDPATFSAPQVKMETASAGIASFLDAYKDIFWGMKYIIMPAIMAIMCLVVGITITISVRERRGEMAVMKVLGFLPWQVMAMIVAEAVLIGLCGSLLSTWAVYFIPEFIKTSGVKFSVAFFNNFKAPWEIVIYGPILGVLVGLAGSLVPSALGAECESLRSLLEGGLMRMLWRFVKAILSSLLTLVVLGLSLLPLSALLLAFPAIAPQESVLEETVARRWGLMPLLRRIFALMAGVTMLIVQLAVAIEMTSLLPLPAKGPYASIARGFLPAPMVMLGPTEKEQLEALAGKPVEMHDFYRTPLFEKLPSAMVQHWPVVLLFLYIADLLLLLFIGKVPLSYNLRNLRVRWLTNSMTALAFLFVIGLLVFLLAFVNGMNDLTQNTGVPGNVFVLSDGATDELFSNLNYEDFGNADAIMVDLDPQDRPIPPVTIAKRKNGDREVPLGSAETYYVVNQPVPNSNPPRRRFVQLRTLIDPELSKAVHGIELQPGGTWIDAVPRMPIPCLLGDGIAETLGADAGKPQLVPGDTFSLGDMTWVVSGVMKTKGTTFGSEIWALRSNLIYIPLGKERATTVVLRTDRDTIEASRAYAHHLNTRYTARKLKAFAEPDYYSELTKTNNDFLAAIVVVAVVMAIGGVFGMMTTMFASIAQRIRDIGVLRLLGFKRWQILVSFMLESLTVALIGGLAGCLLCWLFVDGRSATSTISGGGPGGGKNFAVSIHVSFEVMALGMLFAMMMGRLGGLIPALSSMRKNILDTLR